MDAKQTHNSKLNLMPQDNLQTPRQDIEKLSREKEAAEKEASYYKEHYMKVKKDMDDLFKMETESLQNKKKLKDIIEQKNKIITELKAADKNSTSVLKEELLNVTEKLAEEKKICLNLQKILQKLQAELQKCHIEKNAVIKQLDKFHSDISNYEELKERLTIMTEKQAKLEALYKDHGKAFQESNLERDDTFNHNKSQRKLKQEMEILNDCNMKHNADLQETKKELAKSTEFNQVLIKQIEMKSKTEHCLQQKIQELKDKLTRLQMRDQHLDNKTSSEQEAQLLTLHQLVDKYKLEKSKLNDEVFILKNRVLNIEAISNDLRNEIIQKNKRLDEKDREINELQENKCKLFDSHKSIQLMERQLQADYLEKEMAIRNAADEKLNSVTIQLQATKKELQDSINKQYEIAAESRENIVELNNKIMSQEQKILYIENEKCSLEQELKLISMNRKHCDSNTDTLKKKLEEITNERDEKIKAIIHLRKISEEMHMLANESKAEQKRLYEENDCLREQSFAAKQKLDVCVAEQESQLVEIEMMREKIISQDKNATIEKSKLKKIESQLKQELMDVKSQNKQILSENNKIIHEKEILIKNVKAHEKNLASSNNELGKRNQDLKKLQHEHDKLKATLSECSKKIEAFNLETDNFLKEKLNYQNKVSKMENTIEHLKEDILTNERTISELVLKHNSLTTENTVLQNTENNSKDLKLIKDNLKLQNDQLKENCSFLEDDLNILHQELRAAEQKISSLQEINKDLEKSNSELETENMLLKNVSEKCANLEKEKETLSEKYNGLIGMNDKLYDELKIVRETLLKSRENQSKFEEQIENLQNSEKDLKEKCYCLVINNNDVTLELNQEKNLRQELYEEIENLKINLFSMASDKDKSHQEKVEFENLLVDKDLKIDSLETSNAELIKKCFDFEEKELSYKEEIKTQIEETTKKLEEYTHLRSKYESLGPKLGKYVMQYKSMKQANMDLEEKIKAINTELKNLQGENLEIKNHCIKIELEMKEIKSENENLKKEINLFKVQAQGLQKKQHECLQKRNTAVTSMRPRKTSTVTDDPLVVLDSLVTQVKKSSSPAAIHLLKSCKNIRELIIKEREGTPNQTNRSEIAQK